MSVAKKLLMKSAWGFYNKILAKIIGLHPAIFYSEIASKGDYFEEREQLKDGWFFNTVENMEEDTCLSDFQQREAIKVLVDERLIEYKVKGTPARRYFRITEKNDKCLMKLLENNKKPPRTSTKETKELVPKKLEGNNNKNKHKSSNNSSQPPLKGSLKEKKRTLPVRFNYETKKWENFDKQFIDEMFDKHPNIDVPKELDERIPIWLRDNPKRKPASLRLFIIDWLDRAEKKSQMEADNLPVLNSHLRK